MSLLPTGKFRYTCRVGDAFIKDAWSEQSQASEDLQKDGIRGGGLVSNDRISLAHARSYWLGPTKRRSAARQTGGRTLRVAAIVR